MKTLKPTRQFYLFALIARLIAFLILLVYAIRTPLAQFMVDLEAGLARITPVSILWLGLMICMIFRLFPSRIESLGCQKIYGNRCQATNVPLTENDLRTAHRSARNSLIFWVTLNLLFYIAYWTRLIDARFMVCLAGLYAVVDIFCILFFCPFQSWLMHNRCCTTCRIFDWDYLMICTPLLAIPNAVTLSAAALSAVIFLRWEWIYAHHKERFIEAGNAALKCSQCDEQLCKYKRALAASMKPKKSTQTR